MARHAKANIDSVFVLLSIFLPTTLDTSSSLRERRRRSPSSHEMDDAISDSLERFNQNGQTHELASVLVRSDSFECIHVTIIYK